MTYGDVVARAAARLVESGIERVDAEADARVLARHFLQWDLGHWLTHQRDDAEPSFIAALDRAIVRRAGREPIAYITGNREFYGRSFHVSPAVLIPRPETELLIELSLVHGCTGSRVHGFTGSQVHGFTGSQVHRFTGSQVHGCKIADVGTGSGCLAVTLALELPSSHILATDISSPALDVARLNALALGAGERIEFRHGAFFAGSTETFDLIVSNPPYVAETDRPTLESDVVDFEPPTALFAGADGLACVRELVRLAPEHLRLGGTLIFEFGFGQADPIRALIRSSRLIFVGIHNDLRGIPRVAIATL